MKLAIIGDFKKENATHRATNAAIGHSLEAMNSGMEVHWVATDSILDEFQRITGEYQGFLVSPGSPYASMEGVLEIIRYARENDIPVLGTCGGFQHMVIEFARNVADIKDAAHAETDPYASRLVINPLTCSLAGQTLEIRIRDKSSITYALLRSTLHNGIPGDLRSDLRGDTITENYYCNFGLNPEYQEAIDQKGFRVVATDAQGEARILELKTHYFFIGTLFVPQTRSTPEAPHPLVTGFLRAVKGMHG
jgi:CTP synthase (UTP-ammonia lyase)